MPHRATGFRTTKCYPSVVRGISGHFAIGFFRFRLCCMPTATKDGVCGVGWGGGGRLRGEGETPTSKPPRNKCVGQIISMHILCGEDVFSKLFAPASAAPGIFPGHRLSPSLYGFHGAGWGVHSSGVCVCVGWGGWGREGEWWPVRQSSLGDCLRALAHADRISFRPSHNCKRTEGAWGTVTYGLGLNPAMSAAGAERCPRAQEPCFMRTTRGPNVDSGLGCIRPQAPSHPRLAALSTPLGPVSLHLSVGASRPQHQGPSATLPCSPRDTPGYPSCTDRNPGPWPPPLCPLKTTQGYRSRRCMRLRGTGREGSCPEAVNAAAPARTWPDGCAVQTLRVDPTSHMTPPHPAPHGTAPHNTTPRHATPRHATSHHTTPSMPTAPRKGGSEQKGCHYPLPTAPGQ